MIEEKQNKYEQPRAKLVFKYKSNPTQQHIKDLVNWLYDSIQTIHEELPNKFHNPIESKEEYLCITKGNLFIF